VIYDDALLYDMQYESYRDDLPFYLRVAADQGGPVLELGAGTGRVTAALAAAGHEVVAVDASPAMLARARERLASPIASGQVTLMQADMRDLALDRRFALVAAPFNTLMHAYTLSDQDRTLANVRAHLDRGGAFAFDVYLPRFGALGVVRSEREWDDVGGDQAELFLVQRHDGARQLLESHYHLDRRAPDGLVRRTSARLVQRYYHRFELERALRAAGLTRTTWFGGFDRRWLDEDSLVMAGVSRPD